MEGDCQEIIAVKAVLDNECKRFGIPKTSTFSNLVDTLCSVFACEITDIQYRDGDDDLVSMGSEEEFSLSLECVSKTGGILRLVLHASTMSLPTFQSSSQTQSEDMELNDNNVPTNENDIYIEEAIRRSRQMLAEIEGARQETRQETVIVPVVKDDIKDETRKSEDTHFSSQKPVARKVRRVSSGTTSGGTDKNDKKQSRGRQTQRKKKRKHRESSSSSSDSSSNRSSTSSSTSSSESSCGENYQYYKKTGKKKRKSSPTSNIEKMLHKCEKKITAKVCKDVEKYTKKFREEIISSVSNTILQRLDGAVLQSFTVPNGGAPQSSEVNAASASSTPKPGEGVATKRMRYQHQNVVCDHCENEIFGPRYKCGNCSDYDLCEKCEAIEGLHTPSHVFVKMHFPAVHAGRRSVGGKSRPLLRANIYEEREKEREMEDLLQRKLDSGSELNQKVLEKFEKRRTKMKEDEQAKEAYDNRKEEWKKMKKEIKKNKKELKKKLKQQGKMIQRNITRGVGCNNKEEIFLSKEGFCFDVESLPKVEPKIIKERNFIETSTSTKAETKSPVDEKLSSALSSLQIVHIEPVIINEVNISDNASISNENIIDLTESDDAILVDRVPPVNFEFNTTASPGVEILKKPDLVDFNREVSENTCEEFVVVSNYFDLSVPIDDNHILEHRNCESCQTCHNNFTPDFIQPHSTCTTANNQLPVDLVASVPVTARNQPDIASPSTVNIMDQSIESFSSVTSSPPISPEPVNVNPMDECIQEVSLVQPCEETPAVVPNTPQTSQQTPPIYPQPSTVPHQSIENESILIQPEQLDVVISTQNNESHVPVNNPDENAHQEIHVDEISSPLLNTDNVTSEQPGIDLDNPIIQAQLKEEQRIASNCQNSASVNTFESSRNGGGQDIPEEVSEQPEGPLCPVSTAVVSNNNGGGISGALVGAMASFVDTVAHVVQSAKGAPKAEYHNGLVEVTIPADPRVAGMQQLLDMGFFDRPLNERLLIAHNNDVGRCVADLIAENNNQWHQTRH